MRAHLVQMDIVWEDREANFRRVEGLVEGAGVGPGDLVVLPELFDSGFSLNTDRTHDGEGRTLGFLAGLAARWGCVVQGGRTVVEPGGKATNRMSVLVGDRAGGGGVAEHVAEYAKVHPFSFGREPEAFVGGEEVVTYRWEGSGLEVCPAVCYDLRFPELFRVGLVRGAGVFALGANWPRERQGHWRALLVARAIENQAYVLGVNRVGRDPHLGYAGGSMVVGPKGEVVGELGEAEGVLSADVAPEAVSQWRDVFGAWRDHRLLRGVLGADQTAPGV